LTNPATPAIAEALSNTPGLQPPTRTFECVEIGTITQVTAAGAFFTIPAYDPTIVYGPALHPGAAPTVGTPVAVGFVGDGVAHPVVLAVLAETDSGITVLPDTGDGMSGVTSLTVHGDSVTGYIIADTVVEDLGPGSALLEIRPTGVMPPLSGGASTDDDTGDTTWTITPTLHYNQPGSVVISFSFGATNTAILEPGVFILGSSFYFLRASTDPLTIEPGSGVTFNSKLGSGARTVSDEWGLARAYLLDQNHWVLTGDIA
jgi:hypothetical protein